jgi:hypothetical protein
VTYVGAFAGAVTGLLLRSLLRGHVGDDRVWSIQVALFAAGVAIGVVLDVRDVMRRKRDG